MTESTFTSLEELGEWELAARGRGLHITTRIGGGDGAPPAVHACREAALDWVARRVGAELPRRALRHQSFRLRAGDAGVRAVRERSGRGDFWAARVTLGAETDRAAVTELVVASPRDDGEPTFGVRIPGWPASSSQPTDTLPPAVLSHVATDIPLLVGGAPLVRVPEAVWTPQAMRDFIETLLAPERQLPTVVITEPTHGGDARELLARSERVAAALAGLATVTVLPQRFTYTLSDSVTKILSVYDGAWRVYLPGFSLEARRFDHPVYLRDRVDAPQGVERVTREVFRIVGDHHVRSGAAEGIRFDAVRAPEERLADAAQRAASPWRRVPAALSAVAGRLGSAPRRWGRRRGRAKEAQPPAGPGADAPPSPQLEGAKPAAKPAPLPPADAAVREAAALRRELSGVQRDLRTAQRKGETLAGERDRARELEATVREERDEARHDARRLEGLVRLLGGDPQAPFPVSWVEVPGWCASELEGRVVLSESVRRGLGGAQFEDVALTISCLNWLGNQYRDARLGGGDGHLYGLIPGLANGIRNERCGGDSFDVDWRGTRHRVEWHLKNGGNTRDPRRCLRIYYFWDAGRREVVIADMPAHRRTAIS